MSFVGLDPQAALDLVARFDRAVQDLGGHAQVIDNLFAQAGHPGESGAPGTMRNAAAWAAYRSRDLKARIDKVLVADSGAAGATPNGFRFANQAEAEKAGKDEAKKIKGLLDGGKYKQLEAELAKVKQYANDPNFAAAFIDRGVAYARKGDNNRAIVDYNEAIRLDPKNALAFCNRGRAKLQINETSGNADIAKARELDASSCR